MLNRAYGQGRPSSGPSGRGLPGKDGITPHIGPNGHWFIGQKDTGVPAGPSGGTQPFKLTSAMVSKALDNGQFNTPGSLKSLADGWWVVPDSNAGATGRPPGSSGDLIYFQQEVSADSGDKFKIGMAFGKDSLLKDSVWVQYRAGSQWTAWIKEAGTSDLSGITSQIDELKRGNQAVLDELSKLQTAAGSIFAPTKALFDAEANQLIDAKLATVRHTQTAHALSITANSMKNAAQDKRLTALEGSALTNAEVENYLRSRGWGPNTAPPKEVTEIHFGIGNDYPADFTSQTGTALPHQDMVVTGLASSPNKVWVAVPKASATKVVGMVANGGLPASWDSKDVTVSGKPWTVFISPTALADDKLSLSIRWSA